MIFVKLPPCAGTFIAVLRSVATPCRGLARDLFATSIAVFVTQSAQGRAEFHPYLQVTQHG